MLSSGVWKFIFLLNYNNKLILFQEHVHYNLRKYFFSNWTIQIWNALQSWRCLPYECLYHYAAVIGRITRAALNMVSLVSSVTELMRLPISETRSTASWFITPEVSTATLLFFKTLSNRCRPLLQWNIYDEDDKLSPNIRKSPVAWGCGSDTAIFYALPPGHCNYH